MKSLLIALLAFFAFISVSYSQTLIPVSDELMLPQYSITGNNTASRLSYVCRLRLTGLFANATYRYTVAMTTANNTTTANGPGNMFAINNTSAIAGGYITGHTSGKSLSSSVMANNEFTSSNRYAIFTTDASGNYSGWFCVVPTSNAVFAPGNVCYFYVQVNNGGSGTSIVQSFRTTSTIAILDYGTTSGAVNQATAFAGKSFSGNEEMIVIYDNVNGTGRPIYTNFTENDSITTNFTAWYNSANGVDGYPGRWGTIIPNNLPNGVRRIERRGINNSILDFSISNDGMWGSINTVNPSGGTTAQMIDSNAAPLPVILTGFSASVISNSVSLRWGTSIEINNSGFELQRSNDRLLWGNVSFVSGHGTVNEPQSYSYCDKNMSTGRYFYRLKQTDYNGNNEIFDLNAIQYIIAPGKFEVLQNYPNPFNPVTNISYSIPENAFVKLNVYDITGRLVSSLVNSRQDAGFNIVRFDASNLASGVYFYSINAKADDGSSFNKIMKMLLVK